MRAVFFYGRVLFQSVKPKSTEDPMNPNYIYVEPPFWVASNPDETAVKQLCVELEEQLNTTANAYDFSEMVARCKDLWEIASDITIERYPVSQPSDTDPFPLVLSSSKVALSNLATSDELMDVANVSALKQAFRA